jgi:hypothetical protein
LRVFSLSCKYFVANVNPYGLNWMLKYYLKMSI